MATEVTEEVAARIRSTAAMLPEPLRGLDAAKVYEILLLDARNEVMPSDLMKSPEMVALEGAGLMHEEYAENTHLGVTVEHFQGYRGDESSTALLNRMRAALGEASIARKR